MTLSDESRSSRCRSHQLGSSPLEKCHDKHERPINPIAGPCVRQRDTKALTDMVVMHWMTELEKGLRQMRSRKSIT